jgi:hypothetical protein
MNPKHFDARKRNPFSDLIAVISEEDLVRLQGKLRRNADTFYLADVLDDERKNRHALAEAEMVGLR